MVEGCPELYEYIHRKDYINDRVQDKEVGSLHDHRIETELKWNTECVVQSKNDDKELPLGFTRVVLTYHECGVFVTQRLEHLIQTLTEIDNHVGLLFLGFHD